MPVYNNVPGYTPVDYSAGTREFWGTLFNEHWIPSEVFCHLVDSLFFYVNENCNIPSMKNTGKMEFSKILYVRGAVAGKAEVAKLPYPIWASLYRAMWDNDGVGYSIGTDADGCEHPILNRANWLTARVRDAQYDPDGEHKSWNKIILAFKLTDPQTGLPFPTPIPRTSFPLSGLPQSKIGRDLAATRFIRDLVLVHTHEHIQYARLVTMSGAINCDKCGKVIRGTRYKCKECFDFDECEPCFRIAPPNASSPISPTGGVHQIWHKVQRLEISPRSRVCDVCRQSNMDQVNHCLNCPDYDECDRCFRARGYGGVRLGVAASPSNGHQYWHTFVRSYVSAGTYTCDICSRTNGLTRYHCQFCFDYDECDSCRRSRIPEVSSDVPGPYRAYTSPPLTAPINPDAPPPYSPNAPSHPMTFNAGFSLPNSPVDQQALGPAAPSGQSENIVRIVSNVVGLVNPVNNNDLS